MFYQNGLRVLDRHDVARWAPSVFATEAHGSRSDRYAFVSSARVLDLLVSEGWLPVFARESRGRKPGTAGFRRHQIRFTRPGQSLGRVGDRRAEIVLTGSHDGSSAIALDPGVFELVCSNGMVVPAGSFGGFKVRHVGADLEREVIEGTCRVIEELPRLSERVSEFQDVKLTRLEQLSFAEAAHGLVWDDSSKAPEPHQLLAQRRWEDDKPDLWSTFQRVQENATQGGLNAGRTETGRRRTTRKINDIARDTKLNQALWALTEKMAEIKAAG